MADIQAFRGLRYDLAQIGSLASVVAPPCDALTPELRDLLLDASEHNIARLDHSRGEDGAEAIYETESLVDRGKLLKRWRREQILKADSQASLYIYHQTFVSDGSEVTRRGFIARLRVEPFVNESNLGKDLARGCIRPHEQTFEWPMLERLELMEACDCNLSQIFTVYDDPKMVIQNLLEDAIEDRTPAVVKFREPNGDVVKHELWTVADPAAISQATQLMGDKSLWIADGHHRYTAAVEFQRRREQAIPAGQSWDVNDPANYTMAFCVAASDPGLQARPTHRVFESVDVETTSDVTRRLGNAFDCQVLSAAPTLSGTQHAWELLQLESDPTTLALGVSDGWVLASLTSAGEAEMRQRRPEMQTQTGIGVSILHGLALELLGIGDEQPPEYFLSPEDVESQLGAGKIGCLLLPASVSEVGRVCEAGELLPPKSTCFWPKLLGGLVVNPLS